MPLLIDESLAGFEANAAEAAGMLKSLANEKRLMILCKLLEHGEMGVMALSNAVGLSQSALSQHLARMRDENIVSFRRDGQSIYYHVTDPRISQVLGTLKNVFC
ncbi:MAG TPA: metalloregulator ArsR/SmtB family transcription factor [Aestuariivirga sp.]|nr:helix-turn-helix transcriptional regulator [Alphaproteobacteria bacterium]HRX36211.1 metalloregulator ArsR/SmtB family transcription factor [Aestuariivirga sp.]